MADNKQFRIEGIEQVLKNLNKEVQKMNNRSVKGLLNAAITIRRETEKTPPRVPVDTRNLSASWFIVTKDQKRTGSKVNENGGIPGEAESLANNTLTGPVAVLGFAANYAAAVHEMEGGINWNRRGSGPKYLETHLHNNYSRILREIAGEMEL